MQPLTDVTGVVVPLRATNVDTDQILPAKYLRRVTKSGYEDALFERWRADPDFVLNRPAYQGGRILVAGADFGIGSSREHAVWALRDSGFRVVLSPRFGDIFRGNAGKNGVLAAVVPQTAVDRIWRLVEARPGRTGTVSLADRTISVAGETFDFEVSDAVRHRLMGGLDDIDLTLRHEDEIAAFEARRPTWMPRTLPVPQAPPDSAGRIA